MSDDSFVCSPAAISMPARMPIRGRIREPVYASMQDLMTANPVLAHDGSRATTQQPASVPSPSETSVTPARKPVLESSATGVA